MAARIHGIVPGVEPAPAVERTAEKKKQDALFGPNIGVVSSGPAWTDSKEKKVVADELTPEVVKGWIARSKEYAQPTTTLQALVNLKRPTLRLSPLAPTDDTTHPESNDHHGLEFEYDCDAPKCGIYVHVLLSPDAALAPPGQSRVLVFETVVGGGFGKILKLEEGATLELGRFENSRHRPTTAPPPSARPPTADSQPQSDNVTNTSNTGQPDHRRRRFTSFYFRKRTQARSISGPALAVVDAEASPAGKTKDTGKEADEGVKVTIRLAALDEQGTELVSPNEQVTYLHLVRVGALPVDGEDDNRPWVVKVVKREATIGPHTFHLHEIYGLSVASSQPAPSTAIPSASPPDSSPPLHSYPPMSTAPATATTHHITEDEPSSECLLCLSSPREVVLLPCRHLVACKDCALNMVEFGAGGTITQVDGDLPPVGGGTGAVGGDAEGSPSDAGAGPSTDTANNGEAAAAATTSTSTAEATVTVVAPATQPRRKRRAKGWFCPVCRQPYTSLLRITTSQPTKDPSNRPSTPSPADDQQQPSAHPLQIAIPPLPATSTPTPNSALRSALSAIRPAFLRGGLSAAPDLERGPESA